MNIYSSGTRQVSVYLGIHQGQAQLYLGPNFTRNSCVRPIYSARQEYMYVCMYVCMHAYSRSHWRDNRGRSGSSKTQLCGGVLTPLLQQRMRIEEKCNISQLKEGFARNNNAWSLWPDICFYCISQTIRCSLLHLVMSFVHLSFTDNTLKHGGNYIYSYYRL
jgi:hypothetical protein